MKRLLLSAVVLLSIGLSAQVGINTTEPEATLDVRGDVRIETIEECEDCEWVLVIGNNNIVKKMALSKITQGGNANIDGSGNQDDGGANLGTGVSAAINDKTEYIVSFEYNDQEIQGLINDSEKKIIVKLPYENGNGVSYNKAVSKTMTEANSSQDGVSVPIEMKIPAGTLSNGQGELTAEIITSSEYKVKKLAPGEVEKIADFKYTIGDATRTVTLKAIGGVPDRLYDVQTNGKYEHKYIYIPIKGADGKIWLNNNLGADYANVNSPYFNPTKQAIDQWDTKAWGAFVRPVEDPKDRYILFDWSNPRTYSGTPRSLINAYAKFKDVELCPEGYRLPTSSEIPETFSNGLWFPGFQRMPTVKGLNTSNSPNYLATTGWSYLTEGELSCGGVKKPGFRVTMNQINESYVSQYANDGSWCWSYYVSSPHWVNESTYDAAMFTDSSRDVDASVARCIKK